jgi:hypothetical protein
MHQHGMNAMISDLDSYKIARLMIVRHGAQASRLADWRAQALENAADLEGRNDWINILETIRDLGASVPARPVHADLH